MKQLRIFLFFILIGQAVMGQQLPQFTQFQGMRSYVNPASVGASGEMTFGLAGRNQWMGLKDINGLHIGPESYMFFFDVPVFRNNNGIGGIFLHDRMGNEQTSFLRINAAQHIKPNDRNTISLGVSIDYLRKTFDFSQFGQDPYASPGFPYLPSEKAGGFDIGFGLLYTHESGLFSGVSVHQVLETTLPFTGFSFMNRRQFQFVLGTQFPVLTTRHLTLDLSPAMLVHTSEALVPQYDIQALLLLNDLLYAGIGYRYQDAIMALLGMKIGHFRIGLSYDYTTSLLAKAGSRGSPEVIITYVRAITPKPMWIDFCH